MDTGGPPQFGGLAGHTRGRFDMLLDMHTPQAQPGEVFLKFLVLWALDPSRLCAVLVSYQMVSELTLNLIWIRKKLKLKAMNMKCLVLVCTSVPALMILPFEYSSTRAAERNLGED